MNITQHTDCYFTKSREAAAAMEHNPLVKWQVFQKKNVIVAGMKYVLPLFDAIDCEIRYAPDGTELAPWTPALTIRGRFQDLVELESIYLGYLAGMTNVATNVREARLAAPQKPILFFPARFTFPEVQSKHGYAAAVGGADGCATAEQMVGYNSYFGSDHKPVGTMPHALIAAFGGNTARAALAFAKARPDEPIWVLVDFQNDCVATALDVIKTCEAAGVRIAGIRLDTSEKLIDAGLERLFKKHGDSFGQGDYGVSVRLVQFVKASLIEAGYGDVKIAVSGGFTPEKIRSFEQYFGGRGADVYAIGEGFLKGTTPFTSDIVSYYNETMNLWTPASKVGRSELPSKDLTLYKVMQSSILVDTTSAASR